METEKVSDKLDIDSEFMQMVAGEYVVTYSHQKALEYSNKCNFVTKYWLNKRNVKIFDQGQNRMPFGVNIVQRFGFRSCLWCAMAISKAVAWGGARVYYSACNLFDRKSRDRPF